MTAPKAQTLQQRMGFADPDLKSPKHDELMLALDRNMDAIVASILPPPKLHISSNVDGMPSGFDHQRKEMAKAIEGFKSDAVLPEPQRTVTKEWEYTIRTGRDNVFVVGFADMLVQYYESTVEFRKDGTFSESMKYEGSFLFEVKPSIASIGEVMRQIRHYQTYTRSKWFIATPDTRFRSVFEGQDIGFIDMNQWT